MNKKPLPSAVIFAILTTITVFVWIGFDAYRTYTTEPESDVPAAVLEPLDPSLDLEVLSEITQRVYLEEADIADTVIQTLEEDVEEATPSAQVDEDVQDLEDENI